MTFIASIGTAAAICTTGAFLPQIVRLRKQGGKDLSYSMLFVYLGGILLWLVYGFLIHAQAVIWANSVGIILVGACLMLKATWSEKGNGGRRLRVAIDMDEVIADSLSHHLELYNRATGECLSPEQIAEVGLDAAIPTRHHELFERIPHQCGFFEDLGVIKGSQNALRLLNSRFDIFITSAAMDVPFSFDSKYRWLQKHFPFIAPNRIVFCGDKEVIHADYLVDDRSRHFARFGGTGILFTAPHNARQQAPVRAGSWDEVLAILPQERSLSQTAPTAELAEA